ncbi:Endolytic peptidoglycan transglycosylase RlpA [Candidatus Methylobacter favarea]|uniref:Endolytic peptidoglycan transglycosylase RlpA n=1 Tax=Candidatus Methylobacter favarea TaxID=2707345 RepID=A0A8S0Y9A3_9GAMM|nr:septal ring lytic transglycosylase RlpA family protein [Candidatus Methylobacter favarea]CAA9889856.1 Endolytic peptidoglycan transglycosylase RlpA [Candidatus Methylobacter favarea]
MNNKLLPALSLCVLCSCTTGQIKTTSISKQPPDSIASTPPVKSRHKLRQHSILQTNRQVDDIHAEQNKEEAPREYFFPRIARYLKQGIASWYGPRFHGKKTATGEIFDMYAMTAAHKTLPIPSYAQVTNLENQRSVIVRINDRGPFVGNRVMDLSYAAAKKLDIHKNGTGSVEIKALSPAQALPQLQKTAAKQKKNVYLQVGTFGSQKKALKLKNKIASHHLPQPEILSSTYKASTLYKVQMGPIKSTDSVVKLNGQLAKLGITETQFVTEAKKIQNAVIQ